MSTKKDLHAKLATLSPEKRAFLEQKLQAKKRIPRREPQEEAVLSFAQQRLWLFEQFEPGLPIYNTPFSVALQGDVDLDRLEMCLNEVLDRHEVLRTNFSAANGIPALTIAPSRSIQIERIDLRSLPPDEVRAVCERQMSEAVSRPFDLTEDLLLRATVWQLEERQFLLLLNMHHIACDGWSTNVLIREIGMLYQAFSSGQPSPLAPLEIQYADYAAWQRKWLEGPALQKQLDYWKRQLAGELPVLMLPTDHPRPKVTSYQGASEALTIPKRQIEKLKEFSRQEGGTLFMTLLAAFHALLYRYSGQRELLIGTPVANRNREEIEGLVGFFVNTLVIRNSLSSELPFREFVRQVRDVCLEAYAHQDLPFETLVAELAPDRQLNRSVLFQTMFALNNALDTSVELSGLTMEFHPWSTDTAKFDLSLLMTEEQDRVVGKLEYSTALFEKATIERIGQHFLRLVERVAEDPDVLIDDIRLLDEHERETMLVDWNDTATPYPEVCVHQLFTEQAARTPDAVAVELGAVSWTYRELNEHANRMAHLLKSYGVGPDVIVCLLLDRSLEMMAAFLAVFKAGGAYLPLDPSTPPERMSFLLQDAGAMLVLTTSSLRDRMPESDLPQIVLDEQADVIAGQRADNLAPAAEPKNLAYLIYTSGSTGQPKGTMIEHRGLTNYLLWAVDAYRLQGGVGSIVHSSVAFDMPITSLFPPLLTGKKVVFTPPEANGVEALCQLLLTRQDFSLVKLTPAHLQLVNRELEGEDWQGLVRTLVIGGEALMPEQVAPWQERAPKTMLINEYGPTETVVGCCVHEVSEGDSEGVIPIGRPIANMAMYILDGHQQPVPIGVVGEIYIGGLGVARGYRNREELEAECFLPDPFRAEEHARMYRTGDLARNRADGVIEYVGRIDSQVKIRGFRIELGEIEAMIGQHPMVQDSCAMVREDVPGDKRLVAYLVVQAEVERSEIRAFLKERLPDYMIPSAFVQLDELPLNPNGKVDRRKIPVPDDLQMGADAHYIAPRTELEEKIASIWAEVLRVPQVSMQDNFFELGGHSLLATQVVSRIDRTFDVQMQLKVLFEAPTVASLATRVERLQKQETNRSLPAIVRTSRNAPLPLSFAQQRLWVVDRLLSDTAVYNMPFAVRLQGVLRQAEMERSLSEIIRRHEILRTTFAEVGGQPVQVIAEPAWQPLPILEIGGLSANQQELEMRRHLQAEAARPFDLQEGPLVRFTLLRLNQNDHVLLLNMHHIISDGWSMGVFVNEFAALYQSSVKGEPSLLPELAIQYVDYAAWQRDTLTGEGLAGQIAYWREQLNGELPVLQLPTDHPRPPVQTHVGAIEPFTLPSRLTDALHQLSQQQGVTLFMTLLGAFQTFLSRYSGQEDICVGTAIAGRTRRETEELIGFFVNTLVLRTDLSGQPSFLELLSRVKKVALGAYAHQDLPFEKLVEEMQPKRDPSRSPLFQVLFALQNAPMTTIELPELTIQPVEYEGQIAKFDLSLLMREEEGVLQASFEYNTDLFNRSTIKRMSDHFIRLIESITSHPEQSVMKLQMLSDAEFQQVVVEWNRTEVPLPDSLCLHQLFEQQAARTPDVVAVVYKEQQMTYRELNAHANQLAHYLQQQGVGAETFVGITTERSLSLIIGLLAILKAGGVYVPINQNDPVERILYQLEDANIHTLLTNQEFAEQLPPHPAHVVLFDRDAERIGAESVTEPTCAITLDHLAYVLYTSGSTGRPKGVCVPHRGVVRLVKETDYVSFSPDEVFLQFAPVAFDLSTFEIWGSLLNGARLVLCPAGQLSLSELRDVICEHQVSTLWLTAGLFHQMVDEHLDDLGGVRQLLAGGDVLSVTHVKKVAERWPNCRLINGYGPTENTTFTTCYQVTSASDLEGSVPIGRPISNTTVYVLDRHLQPVPIGVAGELYIGGAGLAREYLNQPELTAKTFIESPFAEGERLYQSGDLVRYLPDATIDFLGRIDSQVKIRGFRIELGEIETMIGQHPAVQDSCAMVREDVPGDKRLVAYLVVQEQAEVERSEIRAFLKERLPDYMIPSAFVQLDELPLNPNGKVDRRRLPIPDDLQMGADAHYIAPRTELEEKIASIWADVLRVPQISMQDNFFDLGGHSLLATQVVSRLQSECGVEIQLRALFETSSAEELAIRVEQMKRSEGRAVATPITQIDRGKPVPLSFAQQRLWVVDRLLPDTAVYNMPFAVRLKGALQQAEMERSLSEIIRRHEILRTTFAEVDDQPMQVIAEPVWQPLPILEIGGLSAKQQELEMRRHMQAEAVRPFDLQEGPLVRFTLLRLNQDDHVLLLNMHHIVSDGWSMGVFIQEFAALYEAYRAGLPSPLPELAIQYADYAVWQRNWLTGDVLQAQLDYWKEQLGGERTVLRLPTDRPRPAQNRHLGATERFELSNEVSESLRSLSHRLGATLFMTLLAAFNILLSRYSGDEDISVGTSIAGRQRREIENLIGFFVNTLVMRNDLSGDPSFLELIERVRKTALEAYEHQDVPFEMLVQELQPERDLSRAPFFQVMFLLQSQPMHELSLVGLHAESTPPQISTAKFDLTLSLEERGEVVSGSFQYNTDLFDASTICRMIGHFQNLLQGIAAAPECPLSELPLLSEEERQKLLRAGSGSRSELPALCVHELFEEQVIRTPDAVAITFEGRSVTYRELEERANRLAFELRSSGVSKESVVALCLERSVELISAMLGVWKAGAAYLPLDPSYPSARLADMLEDANPHMLLTTAPLAERLPRFVHSVLCLDQEEARIGQHPHAQLERFSSPDRLAYLMYTSGSTGRPKGVMIEHRSVVNELLSRDVYRLTEQDTVLHKAPISFDASVFEIFWPLTKGARLVIARPDGHRDVSYLTQLVVEEQISVMHFVPSVLTLFLEEPDIERCSTLRLVFSGGEKLSDEVQQRFFRRLSANLVNRYGPTETTINATAWACEKDDARGFVPIGRPIQNVFAYVLDRKSRPVPFGVVGELHIGGAGVARGYWNRPDLTEEKFIPDPFQLDSQARLYRTGDLVRYREDGLIEYVGRSDHQVKLRGIRIELGEIEAALLEHPGVSQAAVLLREDVPGDPRLIAYLVAKQDATDLRKEWKSFLQQKLPDHMVPSACVMLKRMPLTPSLKLDVGQLPAPDFGQQLERVYKLPRTSSEVRIAQIWSEVLRADQVGAEDNFFELGGHSLLATQVASRIGRSFGVQVPLKLLFEAPTVASLAAQVEQLQEREGHPSLPAITCASREEPLPLSFAQQRLWVLDRIVGDRTAYSMPFAVRLKGSLREGELERAIGEIVSRHEVLRTVFAEREDVVVQVVTEGHFHTSLPLHDLCDLPDGEAEVARLFSEEANRPFDLEQGPLLRGRLIKLADEEHVLIVNMHHIISDGWSMGIFLDELSRLYRSFAAGMVSPLAPLPLQYADYAVWQRRWMRHDTLQEQLAYWKKRLGGEVPALQLPTDHPRPTVQTQRGAVMRFVLSKELTMGMNRLSNESGVSLFMTLLGAFQTLLFRYTGQEDVVVGTPIAGRQQQETEGLIGCFLNTLAMRVDLSGAPTFNEVLRRVREIALEAYANQDVPFEKLVEELQPNRDTSRTPLFQAMLVLQNYATQMVELEELLIEPLDVSFGTAKFDLTLFVQEERDELAATFEYNTDLFETSTIYRMADHFCNLLHEIVRNPERSIAEYSLLSDRERASLLLDWNDTRLVHDGAAPFHHLFEAQVEKTPDAVAVELGAVSWTYRELNEQANRLAHLLKSYGVGPDAIVCIYLDRSLEMMAAFLAVFKAGGAYLPLDPSTPPERMSFMLQDAGAMLVLTTSSLRDRMQVSALQQIVLDEQAEAIARQRADNLARSADLLSLAYLIYTSGSTGQPKGTMIEHRGLTNYLLWAVDAYRLQEGVGSIVHSSVAFDMPITSLFPPLLTGKKVVFTPQESNGAGALGELLLTRQDFSLVKLTPAHLQLLNRELEGEELQGLVRVLVIGGEALMPEHIAPWQERASKTMLINEYGPTETVVGCCVHEVDEEGRGGAIPIGRPIANMAMYILDGRQEPVPIGVIGEIYIGGQGVAKGYRNREELQRERFLPDPFRAEANARMYRTGDLARFRADGVIEYVGRIDSQVKIRGFRIEPGEVEATLYQHPAVREALVVVREEGLRNHRLVAYLVASEKRVAVREIRAFLKRFLTEYMIPSDFVWLEEIPLTSNGKIDHKALPTPTAEVKREEQDGAPRDRLEMQLVRIWEAVLGRSNIGVADNFFELGGHSLLALQMLREIEVRLEQRLSLTDLIRSGTIEQLASLLRKGESPNRVTPLLTLRASGARTPIFFVHPIGGHAICYLELAKALGDDQPVYAFQSPGLEGECEPLDRVEDFAARYVQAMQEVQPYGPYCVGGWSFGGVVAIEMARQLEQAGEEVESVILIDSQLREDKSEMDELAMFAHDLASRYGKQISSEKLAQYNMLQTEGERLRFLLEQLAELELIPAEYKLEQIKPWIAVFRANLRALRRYSPKGYDRPVMLFRADSSMSRERREHNGWEAVLTNIGTVEVRATHHSIIRAPQVQHIAELLQRNRS
ncbi:amino acid adenylation domain-containing protein [Tumebacillus lipolyticus]|uniref:Amino acid adenylation domain-containing protein n=1 Tax=Tumebacillus lipolyticus TaxID=1280370 RepID=A0ABW4ZUM5_9BACL